MNIKKYLERIKYTGSNEPTLETLKNLQKQHLLNIPFENLDVYNKVPIVLSIDKLYDKVVNRNRGGFCYELNGLFFELLQALGYKAKRVSARVFLPTKVYGEEFDHMAIIVEIGGKEYLTDVGFGEFIFAPLELKLNEPQNDAIGTFLIDRYESEYLRVNIIQNGETTSKYIFTTTERELSDFNEMCVYHQTSPDSHFTGARLISLPTETGRITISGAKLIIKEADSVKEIDIKNETEYVEYLKRYFL
jgi:N-hydroxyarylamine O-acetyltransferase